MYLTAFAKEQGASQKTQEKGSTRELAVTVLRQAAGLMLKEDLAHLTPLLHRPMNSLREADFSLAEETAQSLVQHLQN